IRQSVNRSSGQAVKSSVALEQVAEARQAIQLLREVIACAVQLREQAIERIELSKQPFLEPHEALAESFASLADLLDGLLVAVCAAVEHAAALQVRVEQAFHSGREADFLLGEESADG